MIYINYEVEDNYYIFLHTNDIMINEKNVRKNGIYL